MVKIGPLSLEPPITISSLVAGRKQHAQPARGEGSSSTFCHCLMCGRYMTMVDDEVSDQKVEKR